jgi:hypothetical protein
MIYIVTTLFGISGGLITVLKFIVPQLVKLVRKKKEQRQPVTGKIKSKIIISAKNDDYFQDICLNYFPAHKYSSTIVSAVRK